MGLNQYLESISQYKTKGKVVKVETITDTLRNKAAKSDILYKVTVKLDSGKNVSSYYISNNLMKGDEVEATKTSLSRASSDWGFKKI